jgi:uncharacterized membrane protein
MYLIAKLLHIASVVVFLGNIITGLFWHSHALRTRNPALMAHAMSGIIRSDRLFTVPGVVVIISSGVWLAVLGGYPLLRTGWIFWSLILFLVSGVAFMARVAPLQKQLLVLAQTTPFQLEGYISMTKRWEAWGAIAMLTPLAAMALMVLKSIP